MTFIARTDTERLLVELNSALDKTVEPTESVLISPTAAVAGPFYAITALADADVDVSECDMSFITGIVDFQIPKGVTIYGKFASIAITSGKVIGYKK